MPPNNLSEALEVSLKKHRAINIDLSSIPDSLKKIDKAIRDPTVKTSIKVAQTLRPVMKLITKIMTDLDIYDDMCTDIRGPAPQHDDEVAGKSDKGKGNEGLDDGIRDTLKLDEPADRDSRQANGGAEEDDNSIKRDSAAPTSVADNTANPDAADAEPDIDPNITTLFSTPSLTADETDAVTRLIALNDAYVFLLGNLLHKLKAFDKMMTETLMKPAAAVRHELVRVRWDEVVGEWRSQFMRVWVGAGGDVSELA